MKTLRTLYASGIWHRALLVTGTVCVCCWCRFWNCVYHLLLSIHCRRGTLLDALKTVMKDKVSTFKQLPILWKSMRKRNRRWQWYYRVQCMVWSSQARWFWRQKCRFFLPWEHLLWVWLWLFHSLTLASLLETELCLWLFFFASAQRTGLHDGGGRMP